MSRPTSVTYARADEARATPRTPAIVAGLAGEIPAFDQRLAAIKAHWDRAESGGLYLLGRQRVRFRTEKRPAFPDAQAPAVPQ